MNNWFVKNLGDAMLAFEAQAELESVLVSARTEAENPENMAAFIRHESDGGLHCEVKVYLSPACESVAGTCNATPCAKPSPEGLGMLLGSDEAWRSLFPEFTG